MLPECNKTNDRSLTLTAAILAIFAALALISLLPPQIKSQTEQTEPRSQTAAVPAAVSPASDTVPQSYSPGTILDDKGKPIAANAVLQVDNDLFFLTPKALWRSAGGVQQLSGAQPITAVAYTPPAMMSGVPVQELCNIVYLPGHYSIVVLDKSGDLYEFDLKSNSWRLFRANLPFLPKQPDPEFIDLCSLGTSVALLDPERNQIWKVPGSARVLSGFFPDILPWKVKPGDANLGDAAGIAFDGTVYVATRHGRVTSYGDGHGQSAPQKPVIFPHPKGMRTSRLITAAGTPLFVVERENNRVLAIDKTSHKASQFLFPPRSDLRGLLPANDGFWILNHGVLERRDLSKPDSMKLGCHPRRIDSRLKDMIIPIEGMRLPRHPGVFPGARRLYRYGVHEGLDFFYDSGAKTKIEIGTPVRAADTGKLERVDADFKDMNQAQFSFLLNQCARQHRTSPHNEDLFRGCQVWIDHGNRLMTRYAHLSKINQTLKKGEMVERGELIGNVGVSGTGQNLPGHVKFPHLHFEIWLDGRYLGYGLTPTETMALYEDILGHN